MDTDCDTTNWPPVRVAISSDDSYRTYSNDQNPGALFEKAMRYLGFMTANHTATPEYKETLIK